MFVEGNGTRFCRYLKLLRTSTFWASDNFY